MKTTILLAVCAALSSTAHADTWSSLHINTGIEFAGGDNMFTGASRTHVGLAATPGRAGVRLSVAGGFTVGAGRLSIDDPRAIDGTLSLGYFDYGPEVQLALRFGNPSLVDNRIFVTAAYLHTQLDRRLMIDGVAGVGGSDGMRVAVGINLAELQAKYGLEDDKESLPMVLFLVPQQIEIGWIRSAGSDRTLFTMSWGI